MNTLMIKAVCLKLISRIDRKGFGRFYASLGEFQTAHADIFTFIINEYHEREERGVPDPHFDMVMNRIYESTNTYNAAQLTAFFRSSPEVTATAFARRRVPGSWLLYLAYVEGISPHWILEEKGEQYLNWKERGKTGAILENVYTRSPWRRVIHFIIKYIH